MLTDIKMSFTIKTYTEGGKRALELDLCLVLAVGPDRYGIFGVDADTNIRGQENSADKKMLISAHIEEHVHRYQYISDRQISADNNGKPIHPKGPY